MAVFGFMNVDKKAQGLVFSLIRKNHPSATPKAQRPTMRQTVLSLAALALSTLASPALAETTSTGTRLAEELSQAFEQVAEGITPQRFSRRRLHGQDGSHSATWTGYRSNR